MSILLKALKKSEAQRQVGQPPNIHAPIEISENSDKPPRRWLPLTLLSLIALMLAWFGWQQYQGAEVPPNPPSVETVSNTETDNSPEVRGRERSENTRTTPPPAKSIDVKPSSRPIAANFPTGKTSGDEEDEERKVQLSQSFTQFEAAEDEGSESALAEDVNEQRPSAPDNEGSEDADLESTAEALARVAPSNQRSDSGSRPRNSPAPQERENQTGDSEPISYWQVPQSMRDRMPEFRITVLVYAESPEDRFVLINGVRLKEKEELDSGVTLDEIRRDGAVFRYRDYRFLVKG